LESDGSDDFFFDVVIVLRDFFEVKDGYVGEMLEEHSVGVHPPPAGLLEVGHFVPTVDVRMIVRERDGGGVIIRAFARGLSVHGGAYGGPAVSYEDEEFRVGEGSSKRSSEAAEW